MSINIREEVPQISALQDLRSSIDWNPRSEEQWKRIFEKSICYCAYDGDLLVGFARIVEDGVMCVLFDHCIRKNYQKQGIGSQLIQARVDKAKQLGCKYVHGFASDEAKELFKKLGFHHVQGVEKLI